MGREILSPYVSPFDRPEWFSLLAERADAPVIARSGPAQGAAVMMLMRANDRLEPLRNWYSFTWRPIAPEGPEGDQQLIAIAQNLRQQSHRVTLWPMPDEDGSATRTARAFAAAGWQVERRQCDHNHILRVGGRSFAQYWAARPGRMRTTLKRKANKVDVKLVSTFDDALWAEYEAIYEASWKPEEGDSALLRAFAKAEGAAGRLRLALAYAKKADPKGAYEAGAPVAAQFWTVEAGEAYIHKLAHLESAKSLSAGTTLSAALFEQVIDTDKVDLVDFGTGNDPYKADWMEEVRPRYQLDCLDPRQVKSWPPLAKRYAARLAPKLFNG